MPNFETSFIPEQGTTYQSGSKRSVVATIFSVLIILAAGGLSGWVWWQERQEVLKVKALENELSNMESRFDIAKISELGLLDKKISIAKGMLDKHPLPSMLIDYLSDNTVSSIKWKQISYTRGGVTSNANNPNEAPGDSIDLSGETTGYSPLYQQLTHFRTKCKEVTSVELKSFSIDPRTNILSIQMRLVVNPNYATVATLRAKTTADAAAKKMEEDKANSANDVNQDSGAQASVDNTAVPEVPVEVAPPVVIPTPVKTTPAATVPKPKPAVVKPQPIIQDVGAESVPAVTNPVQ